MGYLRTAGSLSVIAVMVSGLVGVSTAPPTEPTSSYIVELASGEKPIGISPRAPDSLDIDIDIDIDIEVVETFDTLIDGFSAELTPSEVEALEQSPEVVAVYPDLKISIDATQSDAPWNLSRLDQDAAPADSLYTYPDSAGAGARVYIVDTGISANAAQLGDRLLPGWTAISDGRGSADCAGHGTHVAGTVASTTYGVAKQASVVPVRVFGCTGSTFTSTVLSGLEWVSNNHPAGTPGIVNLSLGSETPIATTTPDALTNAVNQMSNEGFVMVVAAGNINADACAFSPSRASNALTVAATTSSDARASYSNFGPCVDLFAPGSSIRSLRWNNTSSSAVLSGTSMAAPHIAGVAAIFWAESPTQTARAVEGRIITDAAIGWVGDVAGSPNRLLNIVPGAGASPSAPAASAATAVYRFWSDTYRSHFYTRSVAERNQVIAIYPDSVWRYEGAVFGAYGAQVTGTIPVYRFWSATYNAHFYTSSEGEKNQVIAFYPDEVWKYESIAYYAYPSSYRGGATKVMARFWSDTYLNHFFTASAGEAETVKRIYPSQIWRFEGNVFRVPASYAPAVPLP